MHAHRRCNWDDANSSPNAERKVARTQKEVRDLVRHQQAAELGNDERQAVSNWGWVDSQRKKYAIRHGRRDGKGNRNIVGSGNWVDGHPANLCRNAWGGRPACQGAAVDGGHAARSMDHRGAPARCACATNRPQRDHRPAHTLTQTRTAPQTCWHLQAFAGSETMSKKHKAAA